MNPSDLFWLSVNAYHEARGESAAGVIAVCKVVLNRAAKKMQTVEQIVLAPYQFSWANGGKRPPIKEYSALERCLALAMVAIDEHSKGSTLSGADHYHTTAIFPEWASDMKVISTIGNHIFYKE